MSTTPRYHEKRLRLAAAVPQVLPAPLQPQGGAQGNPPTLCPADFFRLLYEEKQRVIALLSKALRIYTALVRRERTAASEMLRRRTFRRVTQVHDRYEHLRSELRALDRLNDNFEVAAFGRPLVERHGNL